MRIRYAEKPKELRLINYSSKTIDIIKICYKNYVDYKMKGFVK